jgi:hypothetical protein
MVRIFPTEAVLLNLASECYQCYHGLDDVGTLRWPAIFMTIAYRFMTIAYRFITIAYRFLNISNKGYCLEALI